MPLALNERARPRLAARRRRFRLIVLGITFLGCLVVIAGLGALSYHGRLTIQDIRVDGAQELDARALTSAARAVIFDGAFHIFSRANVFLYPEESIAQRLRTEFPRIKDIALSRESMLSQAVIVTIEERVPVHTWCADRCYLVDGDGLIFDMAIGTVGHEFRGGLLPDDPIGQYLLRGRLDKVTDLLSELSRIGFSPISVTIENESDYDVHLSTGYDLKLGFDLDTKEVIRNMQLLRTSDTLKRSDLEYVDLRFGNRVYYRYKNEGQPEAALEDEVVAEPL